MKSLLFIAMFAPMTWAQCPGDDTEPALNLKTKAGPSLYICGFEDRDVSGGGKGKRAFADFTVFGTSAGKENERIFVGEPGETYWVKTLPDVGLEIEELWFFSDKPQPAYRFEIKCDATNCVKTASKCILKMKPNPFPKALGEFKKRAAAKNLGEDGEDLIDQIFAQAFLGDKPAREFYAHKPENLDSELEEAFLTNKRKLDTGCKR